ncbi:MAG: hypothetical protein ACYDCL_00175 [Myxococcales bacterium]
MKATYLGCCFMVTAFGTAFLVMGLVPMPLLWYHDLERQWVLELRPHGLAMDFYGRTLYATLAAGAAFAGGRWIGGRTQEPMKREQVWLWLAYGLSAVALAMCLIGYQLWPRPAQPLPLPPWYVPR